MRELLPDLLQRLRTALLGSNAFGNDRDVQTLFLDARLSPWRNDVPGADTPNRRVDALLTALNSCTNTHGEPALVLLLHVLAEQRDPTDARHRELAALADETERALNGKIFLCYKRGATPDDGLAHWIEAALTARGYEVFMDVKQRAGVNWLDEIDAQIRDSDFLLALLSTDSADSEMVKAELHRAYDYRQAQGHPRVLPIRVGYTGLLPYAIDVFLNPLQYIVWKSEVDNDRLLQELLAALTGTLPDRAPLTAPSAIKGLTLSEDGRPIGDSDPLPPPLPDFDPRILAELKAPGGAVKLRDTLYVVRAADRELQQQLDAGGTVVTIRAARQTGKSSLLVRGIYHMRQRGIPVVALDLQDFDRPAMEDYDRFLRRLLGCIAEELFLDEAELDMLWDSGFAPQHKTQRWLTTYALPAVENQLLLAIDEADRLIGKPFQTDFFGMLRAWNNRAAHDPLWEKLSLALVISTEPYLLIANPDQSPFNVGGKIYLEDFTTEEVRDLNQRHDALVTSRDLPRLMTLLNGHPYLTRKALYILWLNHWQWSDLARVAVADNGPFSDHLRHYHWLLREHPDLRAALKDVIRQDRCTDDLLFFRLLQAGLVKGQGDECACRCDLYRQYFKDKL